MRTTTYSAGSGSTQTTSCWRLAGVLGDNQTFMRKRSFYLAIPFWLISGWWFFFPPSRTAVERFFSLGWYRWLLDLAVPVTQRVQFPIVLGLLGAGCLAFLLFWARQWMRCRRLGRRSCGPVLLWGFSVLAWVVPGLLVWFLVFWGAGYRRLPLEERLHFDTSPILGREAEEIRVLLLSEIRRSLPGPEERRVDRAVASIAEAVKRNAAEWDGKPIRLPSRVKGVPKGFLLSSGTSGMCAPFTLEALVDGGLPDVAFVNAAAHELSHIAGLCAEDEASFAGYLSGLRADDGFARYACAVSAYMDMINGFEGEEFHAAFKLLPEQARQDWDRVAAAYRKYRIDWISNVIWRAYDGYLQAQGVEEGVRSYSRGIRLLGYAWRKGMVAPRPSGSNSREHTYGPASEGPEG